MGTDVAEVVDLPYPCSFKVHSAMCTELMKLVDRIRNIFPEIEAARPRCASGIQALCSLHSAIEKAKLLLQYCSESSRLYLAITGDVIVSRCRRSRNLLEQKLTQVQNMVPVMLAVEISRVIDDLRAAIFVLDSAEEEAGKVVRDLLQQGASASDSMEYSEMKALQLAASRLEITTPKAILIEKRSIKRLLDKVGDTDPVKRKILQYLLYLLKKHGNSIMGELTENICTQHDESISFRNSCDDTVCAQSAEVESMGYEQCNNQLDMLSRAVPPEEFKCPLSLRLMYDPVVIASGQTYERMWIQKWFDEGNDICPKTKMKLSHLSLTPNTTMKDLISKWSSKNGISIDDPSMQAERFQLLENSSTSIASLGSSMNDLRLPIDVSNISLGSPDMSYSSEISQAKRTSKSKLMVMETSDDLPRYQSSDTINEVDSKSLSRLSGLCWASQCKVVEEVKRHLKYDDQAFHSMSAENFVEPLTKFLKNASDLHDMDAGRAGILLLLDFLRENRQGIEYLREDAFSLFSSFIDSELMEEALNIIELLSAHSYCLSKISSSGALSSILKILGFEVGAFHEQALKILQNLSLNNETCSKLVSLGCIPELVPFLLDSTLGKHCIVVLKNLCNIGDGRISVIETNGCVASVAELLEIGDDEDQEHAVAVLLSLCSQRVQYCQLVMDEGVIPALVDISINGNEKGKVGALELLRLLRDIKYEDEQECLGSNHDVFGDVCKFPREKKPPTKTSKLFGMKFSVFSKPARKKK